MIPNRPRTPVTNSREHGGLTVSLGDRTYPIELTSRSIAAAPAEVAADADRPFSDRPFADAVAAVAPDAVHAVVIADENVQTVIASGLAGQLSAARLRVTSLTVPPGETTKSVAHYERLCNDLVDGGTDRRSLIVAIGGGVVGDLAGFVAATFTRGLRLIQVPTTLLAMVDSSVGGKTGINLPGGKNLVGAFWQPELVWINTSFVDSLPDREFRSGLAEVVKYGVIEDAAFFDWLAAHVEDLRARQPVALRTAIENSCRSKARVVADDERETTGRRAILNYGHTFAHAIESTAGYGHFLHGEAVAIGMQMAAKLAVHLGRCDPELLARQTRLLIAAGLPIDWPDADAEAMLPVMARDKKVSHGKLRFVLPTRIGHVELVSDVPEDAVRTAIGGA